MQLSFEMKIGQFAEYNYPMPFQSHEVQNYLNESQDQVTTKLYQDFEKTEQMRTELSPLVRNIVFSSFLTGADYSHPNGHIVNIPNGVLYPVEERCTIGYTDCNNDAQTKQIKVLPLTHDEYNMNINNPYLKPDVDLIWRMEMGATGSYYKRHELISDGIITINSYNLRYLKRPILINLITTNTCELDETVHEDIVDGAVQIAIRTRPQPQKVEQNQES